MVLLGGANPTARVRLPCDLPAADRAGGGQGADLSWRGVAHGAWLYRSWWGDWVAVVATAVRTFQPPPAGTVQDASVFWTVSLETRCSSPMVLWHLASTEDAEGSVRGAGWVRFLSGGALEPTPAPTSDALLPHMRDMIAPGSATVHVKAATDMSASLSLTGGAMPAQRGQMAVTLASASGGSGAEGGDRGGGGTPPAVLAAWRSLQKSRRARDIPTTLAPSLVEAPAGGGGEGGGG